MRSVLKLEIQRELKLPRPRPCKRLQEAGLRHRTVAEDRIEPGDIRAIEKIECLGHNVEARGLAHREVFQNAEIGIHQQRALEGIAPEYQGPR